MTWNTITTQITGHVVTAAEWNDIGENMAFLEEVDYVEFTSDVAVTATTEGTANTVVTGTTLTYEAVPHLIRFSANAARPDNGAAGRVLHIMLFDSTTVIGELNSLTTPAAANMYAPVNGFHRLTPTAASHTYNVKAWVSAGTGNIQAGAGGTGARLPGCIHVMRVPT